MVYVCQKRFPVSVWAHAFSLFFPVIIILILNFWIFSFCFRPYDCLKTRVVTLLSKSGSFESFSPFELFSKHIIPSVLHSLQCSVLIYTRIKAGSSEIPACSSLIEIPGLAYDTRLDIMHIFTAYHLSIKLDFKLVHKISACIQNLPLASYYAPSRAVPRVGRSSTCAKQVKCQKAHVCADTVSHYLLLQVRSICFSDQRNVEDFGEWKAAAGVWMGLAKFHTLFLLELGSETYIGVI